MLAAYCCWMAARRPEIEHHASAAPLEPSQAAAIAVRSTSIMFTTVYHSSIFSLGDFFASPSPGRARLPSLCKQNGKKIERD